LPRSETNEVTPKVADKQPTNKNTADTQLVQSEPVETLHVKTQAPVNENKSTSQRKDEKKGMEASNIENDKALGNFNLENEINKIKIPIPLVELAKNPIYRKQITKMFNFSEDES
jgi:hypothetical protein